MRLQLKLPRQKKLRQLKLKLKAKPKPKPKKVLKNLLLKMIRPIRRRANSNNLAENLLKSYFEKRAPFLRVPILFRCFRYPLTRFFQGTNYERTSLFLI